MELYIYLILILVGLAGGFLGGLLGIGGGVLFIVILPFILEHNGVESHEIVQFTIANSLFATFISALVALFVHYKNENIHPRPMTYIGITSIITTFIVLKTIVNTPWYSVKPFNSIVIILMVYMILKSLVDKTLPKDHKQPRKNPPWTLMSIGVAVGIISPLSGLGGGSVVVPAMHNFLKVNLLKANSVSMGVIALNSIAAVTFNFFEEPTYVAPWGQVGLILFDMMLPLVIGVAVGSPMGVFLAKKLNPQTLKITFIVFLSLVVLKKAFELFGV